MHCKRPPGFSLLLLWRVGSRIGKHGISRGDGSFLSVFGDELAGIGGRPRSTVPPRSARRAFIFESDSAVLISLLSFSMISVGVPPSIEYIRAGRLRGLAVATATRAEVLPDLPLTSSPQSINRSNGAQKSAFVACGM